jgi:hypothetical protein
MKTLIRSTLLLAAASAVSMAQQWEFGGTVGANLLNTVNVSGSALGSGTAGFENGISAGGYVGGFTQYTHLGGELHYLYSQSNLMVKNGGAQTTFSGAAHTLHYDVIFKTAQKKGKVQLFAAVGGGMKDFRGTGAQNPYQSLYQIGLLTHTSSLKPMGDFGAGAKFMLNQKVFIRAEFRDYITPFPTAVITPLPGVKYGSILQDIVPMVTIGMNLDVPVEK